MFFSIGNTGEAMTLNVMAMRAEPVMNTNLPPVESGQGGSMEPFHVEGEGGEGAQRAAVLGLDASSSPLSTQHRPLPPASIPAPSALLLTALQFLSQHMVLSPSSMGTLC